jgi:hypothetical protein
MNGNKTTECPACRDLPPGVGPGWICPFGHPIEAAEPQTTDPNFPEDDGTRSITSEAYRLAERAYVKNQGQAYFEDLLIRATIGLCRKSYLDD